ncbi:MAG: PepSY domain-containing protein [Candidatus Geothermarchaeales archaeon]
MRAPFDRKILVLILLTLLLTSILTPFAMAGPGNDDKEEDEHDEEDELREKAEEAIKHAEERIRKASEKLDKASLTITESAQISQWREELDTARDYLHSATEALAAVEFENASTLAQNAEETAKGVIKSIKAALDSADESSGEEESPDGEGEEETGGAEEEEGGEEEHGEEGGEAGATITEDEAVNIAIDFLKGQYGERDYTVVGIELEEGVYEIEITDGENEYEVKVAGSIGDIIGFEAEEGGVEEESGEAELKKIEVKSRGGTIHKTMSGLMDAFFIDSSPPKDADIRFKATVELRGTYVKGHARLRIKATVDGERVELNAEWDVTDMIGDPSDLLFKGVGNTEVRVEGQETTKTEGIPFTFQIRDEEVDIADGSDESHIIVSGSSVEKTEFVRRDDDKDGVDDEKESHEERKLETKVSEDSAKVESKIEKEDMENEFKVTFETKEGVNIEVKYEAEAEMGENETEAELKLGVIFLSIVEYIDNDGTGALSANDTTVQIIKLTELSYSQPNVTLIRSEDNETGYRFESHSLGNFTFQIIAVVFEKYALVNGTLVSPTETKITIGIENFPYKNETSMLALQISATSKMEIEEETSNTEREVKVVSEIAEGYFSWVDWVIVDGDNQTVGSSLTQSEGGTLINLCYPRGNSIVHDPKLGVGVKVPLVLTPLLTTPAYMTTIVAVTLVAMALYFIGRRELRYPSLVR